jgi:polysaccharide export outer membrane protein
MGIAMTRYGLALAVLMIGVVPAAAISPANNPSAPLAASGADASLDDYKLGVGDHVRITVYNEETLSGEFQVSANGKVSLPLIGDIQATDRTTPQLAATVQAKLADGYLRDPHVSAEVVTYRPFFILGEVKTPAQYPYVNGMTVMNAVATAGGFTPRASRKKVFVRHAGEDGETASLLTPDLRIRPGDTIRIGERYF